MKTHKLLSFLAFWCIRIASSYPTGQPARQTVFRAPGPVHGILNDETDKFINDLLKEWNSPAGLSVAVVQLQPDGTWLTETKGYGIANANGDPVDGDTLFAIGSNSKLFDVFATGLLMSNTSLSSQITSGWDTKLVDIIPDWELMDPIASAETTITDAMSHRTGLPRHDVMYRTDDTITDIVNRLKYLKPSAPFRSLWQYNNIMYSVLSMLPSIFVPGTTFREYVKANIFDKLGMNSTTYDYEVAKSSGKLANGFGREGMNFTRDLFDKGIPRPMEYWNQGPSDIIDGPGGIMSSANDIATWLKALLLGGYNPFNGKSVIPPEVVLKAFWGASIAGPIGSWPELSPVVYGGGQSQFSYRGQLMIEHGGGTPGFLTQISRAPFSNFGVSVFSNDEVFGSVFHEIVKFHLIDKVLLPGQPRIDWNTRIKMVLKAQIDQGLPRIVPPPAEDKTKPPLRAFEDLAGVYDNPGYKDIELCYLAPNSSSSPSTRSKTCRTLLTDISTRLPRVFDRKRRPIYVISSPHFVLSHIVLEHFDGNLFNVTAYDSRRTINDSKQPYWAALTGAGIVAEFGVADRDVNGERIGLALKGGVWGASPFAPPLKGDSVEQSAEIWFESVTK